MNGGDGIYPISVMAKPAGPACNMACSYCYYLGKKDFFPDTRRTYMSDETLEEFVRQYIEAAATDEVVFTWHGGEALLRPLEFYRKALAFQKKYADGKLIGNCLQTNGLLLNDEWCRFLRQNRWLVGISIDGPEEFHDAFRKNQAGKGTFQSVMRAIRLMQKYGVEWNAMAVVNSLNVKEPLEFYRFFKEIGCRFLQFTPIVERINPEIGLASVEDGGELTAESVKPAEWGRFLCAVFDEWVRNDVGEVFVQLFDATLANWASLAPGVCSMAPQCGHAPVIEHNGDVYCCDHLVFPQYKLGNIHDISLKEMSASQKLRDFGLAKQETLPYKCRHCRFLFACNGECPKNRFASTSTGEKGFNYLCEGYLLFFRHVEKYMDYMLNEINAGRPASNIMNIFKS